jgi:hypothetical protein
MLFALIAGAIAAPLPNAEYRLPCVLYIDGSIVAREAEALPEAAPAELEARMCNCVGCMPC